MYVIGTAGHVDHGKSTLVHALTGIDPDRLQEEKDRGLTIDLGFAWLELPSGEEVSIVDVPGHERFIKNMLAGVGGIDLALLVIAADEGIMPQTREHLAILDLLDVDKGVVALAKKDLVEDSWIALVREELDELLSGTTLAGSPIVSCSARSGEGLPELLEALSRELVDTAKAADHNRPRLPIDRVFTMAGFGTVVTGTLLDGSLRVGDEVEVLPGGERARIRGLQNHKQKTEVAVPGRRTAVNLVGVPATELARGMQLAHPTTIPLSSLADVRLRALSEQRLKHNARVMAHHFSAEVEARVSLLEIEQLSDGEGWAQLRLSAPLPLVLGDRFVLRAGGATLGGGEVVDIPLRRHRRGVASRQLEALSEDKTSEALRLVRRLEPCAVAEFSRHASGLANAESVLQAEIESGAVVHYDGWLLSSERHDDLRETAMSALNAYHERHPLRRGMPIEELRARLNLNGDSTAALIKKWAEEGTVRTEHAIVANAGWKPQLSPAQEQAMSEFLAAIEARPFAPEVPQIDAEVAVYAEATGRVVRVGDLYFGRTAYDEMKSRIVAAARTEPITLAQVRDMFGTSRRYSQAFLEHLDQLRVTRRVGDARVLRERQAAPPAPQGTEAS